MNNVILPSASGRALMRALRSTLAAAALAACGGDSGTEPPEPPRAAAIAISPQSAALSALGETAAFSATVTDQFGAAFAGTVSWSSSNPGVFTVSATGVVSAVANGSGTVTASIEALSATAQVVVAQAPAAVAVVSGGGQAAMPGSTLAVPVTVRVDDGGGSPVEGATVTFAPADGHGSADPATAATDADGLARTTWTLGDAPGPQTLTASAAAGVSTEVRASALDLVPATVTVVSGGGQEAVAGSALADPVVVRVDDGMGAPVEGAIVTFTAAAGHGSADPATAATGADGLARTTWTLGDAVGTQVLTASAGGGVSAEVRATALAPAPAVDSAAYSVVFTSTWSAATHPTDYPGSAHFSPLIGAVHNDGVRFWESGGTATPGIESMAETGGTSALRSEIRARMPAGARSVISGPGLGTSPGAATISRVVVRTEYPLVTLVTMIAPSPDWFVGVSGLSLIDESGDWVDELEVTLYPYDAGTDDGTTYTSANADSSPKQPISSLRGTAPFSDAPIGTFTFTRIGG